jgi:hypothetical protein
MDRAPRLSIFISMDSEPKTKRDKKSDKAKEKVGRPSSKHARLAVAQAEAAAEKRKK